MRDASGSGDADQAGRPSVSVVVPFGGSAAAATSTLEGLRPLETGPGDEVIVSDNSPDACLEAAGSGYPVQVVRATAERSSYHARNAGAERASGDWILFMDADCRPDPDLLDAYFAEPVDPRCGLLAGGVIGDREQRGILPGWARSRRQLSELHTISPPAEHPHPSAGTPNLLVRREAWEALGGFHEGVRSGADLEFCWRAQDGGWTLEHRPNAIVRHRYRRTLASLLEQGSRHAAGRRWMARRYPGAWRRPRPLAELGRSAAGIAVWTLSGRFARAAYKAIDAVAAIASAHGWWLASNRVRSKAWRSYAPAGPRRLVVITDGFPARSETFVYNEVLRLRRLGWHVRVESSARPARVERGVARTVRIDYLEDDPPAEKAVELARLFIRHPWRYLLDRRSGRRWRREEAVWPMAALAPAAARLDANEEPHLHAHFAAGAALHALRLSRICSRSYSVTAHAYDIFESPRNLAEKLRGARFAVAECEYTAQHLRGVAGNGAPVHRIATGADLSFFRRRTPYPGGGRVVAIGRLVEKKGFEHLIRAGELVRGDGVVEEIAIAGEGPLAGELRQLCSELRLEGFVRLLGPVWGPEAVRELLEGADVLAVPSVVASTGDRDALPLVAYEALAMEVPVVASDLVGLPEVVRPPWGELVPPGDVRALAATLRATLSKGASERAAAGAAGRQFAAEFDPERETRRLGELLDAAVVGRSS